MFRRRGQRRSGPAARRAAEFELLLRVHIPALYRSAYRWTGSTDRAEDLVQDLLLKLFPRLDELKAVEQLRPWATRVMYRIFVDQLRRERSSPVRFDSESLPPDDGEHPGVADESPGPPELTENLLTQERLTAAWTMLSDEHRVVLALHDIEGYGLAELEDMTGIPVGTLKSRLHRARLRLRDLLLKERFDPTGRVSR
ncbi:MAG: RNA polymerase sigma factor [Steroidobacteraceae bacterium]